jgi:hypothetical protein
MEQLLHKSICNEGTEVKSSEGIHGNHRHMQFASMKRAAPLSPLLCIPHHEPKNPVKDLPHEQPERVNICGFGDVKLLEDLHGEVCLSALRDVDVRLPTCHVVT